LDNLYNRVLHTAANDSRVKYSIQRSRENRKKRLILEAKQADIRREKLEIALKEDKQKDYAKTGTLFKPLKEKSSDSISHSPSTKPKVINKTSKKQRERSKNSMEALKKIAAISSTIPYIPSEESEQSEDELKLNKPSLLKIEKSESDKVDWSLNFADPGRAIRNLSKRPTKTIVLKKDRPKSIKTLRFNPLNQISNVENLSNYSDLELYMMMEDPDQDTLEDVKKLKIEFGIADDDPETYRKDILEKLKEINDVFVETKVRAPPTQLEELLIASTPKKQESVSEEIKDNSLSTLKLTPLPKIDELQNSNLLTPDSPSNISDQNDYNVESIKDNEEEYVRVKRLMKAIFRTGVTRNKYILYQQIYKQQVQSMEAKPIIVNKYSRGSFFGPDQRRIFFTDKYKKFAWSKPNSVKVKKTFSIKNIVEVRRGKSTQIFTKFKKANPKLCFSILMEEKDSAKESRTIDIECKSSEDYAVLSSSFERFYAIYKALAKDEILYDTLGEENFDTDRIFNFSEFERRNKSELRSKRSKNQSFGNDSFNA